MLELRHLRLLIAIEDEGSLSAAAARLGYSQPAASQQLRTMERRMATPLVLRVGRRLRLTEAGGVLVAHARQIVAASARAESEVAAIAGLRGGSLRLVSFASAAATILPPALARLRASFPGLELTLREAETEGALKLLREGECDVAIVYEWRAEEAGQEDLLALEPGERAVTLVEERAHLALSTSHRSAHRPALQLAGLREETWIAGCPLCRSALLVLAGRAGFVPRIGFETDDYVALLRLVQVGLGVALVTDLMLDAVGDVHGVVLRSLSPAVSRVVKAVVSDSVLEVPGVRQMLQSLRLAAENRPRAADGATSR